MPLRGPAARGPGHGRGSTGPRRAPARRRPAVPRGGRARRAWCCAYPENRSYAQKELTIDRERRSLDHAEKLAGRPLGRIRHRTGGGLLGQRCGHLRRGGTLVAAQVDGGGSGDVRGGHGGARHGGGAGVAPVARGDDVDTGGEEVDELAVVENFACVSFCVSFLPAAATVSASGTRAGEEPEASPPSSSSTRTATRSAFFATPYLAPATPYLAPATARRRSCGGALGAPAVPGRSLDQHGQKYDGGDRAQDHSAEGAGVPAGTASLLHAPYAGRRHR